jgi:protein-disulfide isomerase
MKSVLYSVLAGAAASIVVSSSIVMWDRQQSEMATKAIVEKVISENPELITKSLRAAQAKKTAATVAEVAKDYSLIERDLKDHPNFPVAGNPAGDVTVVEFFDYHCGYCKHFVPTLKELIEDDHNIRVVFKEFPILSDDSAVLAKAALAVNRIDPSKYYAFHVALMDAKDSLTPPVVAQMARDAGIDPEKFTSAVNDKSLDEEIARNKRLGDQLTLNFTPAVIVAGKLVSGNPTLDVLKEVVAKARGKAIPR